MSSALLVIDVQKVYSDPESDLCCPDAASTVDRVNSLIRFFEAQKLPILFVRHIHKVDRSDLGRMFDYLGDPPDDFNFKEGTDEVEYDSRLHLPSHPLEICKSRYSAFVGTGSIDNKLKELGVSRLVICGFMTNFCCESTARDAHDRDYFVDFVVDATGTPGTENFSETRIREIVAEFLGEGFARVLTTDECLEIAYK